VGLNILTETSDPGWTVLTPSADTRFVYVSSSFGNDANNGLSSASPKKSLAAAMSALRTGFPDWLLLNRGDTWSESFGNFGLTGRSPTEPLVIATYGSDRQRPTLRTGNASGFTSGYWPGPIHDVAIVGIHFLCDAYDGVTWNRAIEILDSSQNLLVEDCSCEGYNNGIVFTGAGGRRHTNVKLRRNLILDCWTSGDTGGNGLFLSEVDGCLLEGNLIDDNGWIQGRPHSGFPGHNAYLQSGSTAMVIRENIVARTDGIQARSGGTIENNLFLQNAIALLFGGGVTPDSAGDSGSIRRNVILDGNDFEPGQARGWGIDLSNISRIIVDSNVIAHNQNGHSPFPITFNVAENGRGVENALVTSNVVYSWGGSTRFLGSAAQTIGVQLRGNQFHNELSLDPLVLHAQPDSTQGVQSSNNVFFSVANVGTWTQVGVVLHPLEAWKLLVSDSTSVAAPPAFPDAARTISSYQTSIGGGSSLQAFIDGARQQSRTNWRTTYTAAAVNDYVRAGFGL
jgi:hypothetical protein